MQSNRLYERRLRWRPSAFSMQMLRIPLHGQAKINRQTDGNEIAGHSHASGRPGDAGHCPGVASEPCECTELDQNHSAGQPSAVEAGISNFSRRQNTAIGSLESDCFVSKNTIFSFQLFGFQSLFAYNQVWGGHTWLPRSFPEETLFQERISFFPTAPLIEEAATPAGVARHGLKVCTLLPK